MIKEKIKLKGRVKIIAKDKNGKVKDKREIDNLIVAVGKDYLASWLATDPQSGTFMKYIAIGTGTTAPTSSDTALQAETDRAAGTLSSSGNSWKNTATITLSASAAITEAGLFSASTGGTMFSRVTFSAVNLSAGESITIEWTVTFN